MVAPRRTAHQSTQAAAALAMAALILYPLAIMLPIMKIRQLGHMVEDSILTGVITLLRTGEFFVGIIVLIFSLIVPPVKLVALLALSLGVPGEKIKYRALTYHFVELLGRWGMLDVMVVAVLVAYVKLGDTVNITPGSGLFAFAACVLLSLGSSLCFPPHALWSEES
jgi:paraquat-inducible protein A